MKQFLESQDLLQTITGESEKINEDARRLVGGLTYIQLNWKPAPESWSIAQCLDHLAVTLEKDDQYFTKAIARAQAGGRTTEPGAYRPTFFGGWLIKRLEPETKRKMRAPKVYRPTESTPIEGALEKFLRQQERFLGFVSEAHGLDYNKIRLRSAVTPFIRCSLADAFVVTVVHGQRHLAQARRVRAMPGFPN